MMRILQKYLVPIAYVCCLFSLSGCSASHLLILDPQGPIARGERDLLLITVGLMLLVIIPVFVLTFWFAWKYRASNPHGEYAPKWSKSIKLELLVWLGPTLIIVILGTLNWIYTHRLDPYKAINNGKPPVEVQVIAMDWKWLFIYPGEGIAVVNQLVIPSNRPVHFDITSNTVMNSFFIPQLGGQIYAMAGMKTQLNLLADKPGTYFGENTQFSGRGFPDQHFKVIALTPDAFQTWLQQVKQSPSKLDQARLTLLTQPSVRHPVIYYGSIAPHLFQYELKRFGTRHSMQ
ncbi:MAG: ubiquinol oxidase subunit II [Pseudomonadota bacterium]